MKKTFKRLLVAALSFATIFSGLSLSSKADTLEGRTAEAYLAYADSAWTYQYWGGDADNGVVATNAEITGDGNYTVALDFTKTEAGKAEGLAFSAVVISSGSAYFPGAYITVTEVKVNGEAIEYGKGYTSSDDGKELRSNIYNEWVSELPEDAKRADGDMDGATPTPVSADAFASVETVEVNFTVSGTDTCCYIAYADSSWNYQNWGTEDQENGVKVREVDVTREGQYTVALDFTETEAGKAEGCAFAGLMVNNLEVMAPGSTITIDEVLVNGEAVEVGKYYTSSDDGVQTRVNLYNEWVSEVPEDARRADGDLDGATPTPIAQDVFASVETIEVTFTVAGTQAEAYIMYADNDWAVQYWNADAEGVVATKAIVDKEGEYSVALNFESSANGFANGCAFAALGIANGENLFPGWCYTINSVEINGEAVEVGEFYTSSDDGITTRVNLMNEWVSEIPDDARRADGELDNVTATPVSKELFGEVKSIVVNFTATWGAKPVVVEAATDVHYDYVGEYNAYLGCQTNTELWIFRNAWSDETYGGRTNPDVFAGLYDTTNETSHPGTFTDAVVSGDGTYTVKLNGADFGNEDYMSQLFVSFDMPYSSDITFTDVTVSVNGKNVYTVAEGYIPDSKEGDYLTLSLQNDWDDNAKNLFSIMFPVTDIEVTFTINGMGYEGTQAVEEVTTEVTTEATEEKTETSAENLTTDLISPAPEEDSTGVPAWVWVVIGVVCAGAIAAVVVVTSKKKAGKKEEK